MYFLTVLEARKSKIKAPEWSHSYVGTFPGSQLVEGMSKLSGASFKRMLMPEALVTSSPPEGLLLIPFPRALGFLQYEFEGDADVQITAQTESSLCKILICSTSFKTHLLSKMLNNRWCLKCQSSFSMLETELLQVQLIREKL